MENFSKAARKRAINGSYSLEKGGGFKGPKLMPGKWGDLFNSIACR